MTADRITMLFPFTRRWAALLQHRAYRRHLLEMDDYRLRDLGLSRGNLEHGDLLRTSASPAHTEFRRRGALIARGWTLKLYVPETDDTAMRPEDHALARLAIGSTLAEPGTVHGFAILCRSNGPGVLRLTSWWWEGACLCGSALDVPATASPCRGQQAGLDVRVIGLIARECAAWRCHVLDAPRSDCAAYLAEDCA